MSSQEKIKELEDSMRKWPYNKSTEKAFAFAKAQVAKLRDKIEKQASKKGKGAGFGVKKSGDATGILLGFPSVGKSTLLNKVTKAKSKVSAYKFTTLDVVPGILEYNSAKIQILDIPGIITGAAVGRGRGKEILAMVRNSDLVIILIDAQHPEHHKAILKEIADAGVRINQEPPDVRISKKSRGGLDIATTVPLEIDVETIQAILKEFKISNADIVIRSRVDIDSFIDSIEANRHYVPAIVIVTKADLINRKTKQKIIRELSPDLFVSAEKDENIEDLKELIFSKLRFIRLYMKRIGKKPDLDVPMILTKGATIKDVCNHIHREFARKFKFARIWGKSAKFPGQSFRNINKELEDGDIVEVHA